VLSKHNIITKPKVTSFLQPIKDDLGFKTLGLYSIAYMCGKVCIGETRISKHHWHMWLYHTVKSAEAEHSINWGHHIQFHDIMECIIREAIEMELHPDNTNRGGFSLSKPWKHLIQTLKEQARFSLRTSDLFPLI
jgi:hypothetical protein